VLPYPRLLALYQKECQVNTELRKEIEHLRYLLELRGEAVAFHSADNEDSAGEDEAEGQPTAEVPRCDDEEVKTECVDERRDAEVARF
jgi:hypothetical protein